MNEAEIRALLAIPEDLPVAGSVLAALESVPVPEDAAGIAAACLAAVTAAGMLGGPLTPAPSPARPERRRY